MFIRFQVFLSRKFCETRVCKTYSLCVVNNVTDNGESVRRLFSYSRSSTLVGNSLEKGRTFECQRNVVCKTMSQGNIDNLSTSVSNNLLNFCLLLHVHVQRWVTLSRIRIKTRRIYSYHKTNMESTGLKIRVV